MLPLTHWTSVTTSTSVHGPEQEVLLDELEELLDDEDDDEEIAEDETDELDGDDREELLESDDDTLETEELDVEELLLLELGQPPKIHHFPWCSAT